jgi:hypothetical protein
MRFRNTARVTVAALMAVIPLVSLRGNSDALKAECVRTAHSQTYSNAVCSEETGDVVAYELAIQERNGSSIKALLYDYEGVPKEDGIGMSGQISGRKLTMTGNWIDHRIEESTKKEIVETRLVKIKGTLDLTEFRGTIKFQGLVSPISVGMKRVDHIGMCKR